jgi:ABC-type multidrug transport system ATPase subunit
VYVVAARLQMSHALNLTTIISLLQPPPEVFNMFDDLLLLANGKMLYHGPLQVSWHNHVQAGAAPVAVLAHMPEQPT